MARYGDNKIIHRNNNSYYETTYYNEQKLKNDDRYFISQQGDRCDTLANEFYGDPHLWWFIAKINGLNSMNIPAGTNLRLPQRVTTQRGY